MARRRRSPIGMFTQSLLGGLQAGWQHRDRQDAVAARREAINAQVAKNAQQAEFNKSKLGIEGRKADAYIDLSGANAALARAKAGNVGKGGGAAGLSAAGEEYLNATGGALSDTGGNQGTPVFNVTSAPADPPVGDPPSFGSDTSGLHDAAGGKIPKMARGGRAMRSAASGATGALNTVLNARMYNDRQAALRTPSPVSPKGPVGTGTTGPGSGYGETAPPPQAAVDTGVVPGMTYQHGGRVQHMQAGGSPGLSGGPMAGTSLMSQMGAYLGSAWWNRIKPGVMPPATSSTPGPGQPLPPHFTAGDRGASQDWVERGPSQTKRTDRGHVNPRGPVFAGEEARADETRAPTEPAGATENRDWAGAGDQGDYQPPANGAPRGGARGGGAGYRPVGGMLGDQRRTTAYDPTLDANDPRNVGIINQQGAVDTNKYALLQREPGGIGFYGADQQSFNQGGRVQRMAGGGMPSQGAGEPAGGGQAEADALTELWRNEAYAIADGLQRTAGMPMAPADQAGGVPQAQSTGAVPVPPLPERDPAWARPAAYQEPQEASGTGQQVRPLAEPTRPAAHDEAAGQPRQQAAPPPFVGEEARADETPRAPLRGEMEASPAPRAVPAATPGRATPAGPSDGQLEADRLTEEFNRPKPAAPAGQGAITTKPPMAQGVGEPMGGQGLAGPGPGISTNNAARDYLGAATTFANWAMKDAGPQNKDQATHGLYSGKGAASADEIGAMFMTVDPDNKMPLDKRMEASAKALHDFYIAKGDPKMAAEAVFNVTQFGVAKSREHGAAALKALQGGNEQAAMRELMAGYAWVVDKGSAKVQGQNLVVTGDDGKVRATIPLQPGAVQNLAMGMMTGQLAWDAIRRGDGAAAAPAQAQAPAQAVTPSYPATGNGQAQAPPSAPAAQPQAAPAGPATPPAAPASPPQAITTAPPVSTPPAAKPATAPQSAAPAAPRPSPPSTPVQKTGEAQPPSVKPSTPGTKAGEVTTSGGQRYVWDGRDWVQSSVSAGTAAAKPAAEAKTTPASTSPASGNGKDTAEDKANKEYEKKLKDHFAKKPFEPPPVLLHQHAQEPPELGAINDALKKLDADHARLRTEYQTDPSLKRVPKGEASKLVGRRLAELDKKYGDKRREMLEERKGLTSFHRQQQAHEANVVLKPRKLSTEEDEKLDAAFKKRAGEIDEVKDRKGKEDPEKKRMRNRTVLRYQIDDEERRPTMHIAREILRHNEGLKPDKAVEHAIAVTSIIPEAEGRSKMNYQKGQNATEFRPLASNLARGVVLQMSDGTTINVDANTMNRIKDLHQHNWQQHTDTKATAEVEARRQAKQKKGAFSTQAIQLLPPGPLRTTAGAITGAIAGGR